MDLFYFCGGVFRFDFNGPYSSCKRKERKPESVSPGEEEEAAVLVVFGIFFWILIGSLIVAIIARYLVI